MKKLLIYFSLISSSLVYAAETTDDTGKITNLYLSPSGTFLFKINGGRTGLPNAVNKFSCTTGGGWVTNSQLDSTFKSAILAAKATGDEVVVTVDGCEGGWFKVRNIFVN